MNLKNSRFMLRRKLITTFFSLCIISTGLKAADWDFPVQITTLYYKVKIMGIHSGFATLESLGTGKCTRAPGKSCYKFRYSVKIDLTLFGETRIVSDVEFFTDSNEPHYVRHLTRRGDKVIPLQITFRYEIAKMEFIEPDKTYTFDLLPTSHIMATLPISLRYGKEFDGNVDGALFYDDWLREIKVNCRYEAKERICGMNGTDYLRYYGPYRVPTYILLVPIRFLGINFGNVTARYTNNADDIAQAPKYTATDFEVKNDD
ncbi:MAG: hypothetical protein KDK38_01455 [Leptospiraceae bacterium]|nr:hypothetical protein [Leptospiraceae bacterium]